MDTGNREWINTDLEENSFLDSSPPPQGSRVRRLTFVGASVFAVFLLVFCVVAYPFARNTKIDQVSVDKTIVRRLRNDVFAQNNCGVKEVPWNYWTEPKEECPLSLSKCECIAVAEKEGKIFKKVDDENMPKGCFKDSMKQAKIFFNRNKNGASGNARYSAHCSISPGYDQDHKNVTYGDAWLQKMDLVVPKTDQWKPVPEGGYQAVMVIHGRGGDKWKMLEWCKKIAKYGKVAIAVNYRYGHAVEDVLNAVSWFHEEGNADKFNVNPRKIIIMGYSLGGVIASLASLEPAAKTLIQGALVLSGIYGPHGWEIYESMPPVSVYQSSTDPHMAFSGLQSYMDKAQKRGARITFNTDAEFGHYPQTVPSFWKDIQHWMNLLWQTPPPAKNQKPGWTGWATAKMLEAKSPADSVARFSSLAKSLEEANEFVNSTEGAKYSIADLYADDWGSS